MPTSAGKPSPGRGTARSRLRSRGSRRGRRGPPWTRRPLLALILLVALLGIGYAIQAGRSSGHARHSSTSSLLAPGVAQTPLSALPAQAQHTVGLIRAGGPFPFSRDGIVFSNFEHLLPAERSGYYHEYTVQTPGDDDRGARRVISGAGGEFYYTGDHYARFVRIDLSR